MLKRKLRAGMVGGGIGAFIGPVHRAAATMDGLAEYVAGAFSSDPEKSRKSGEALFFAPDRVYAGYKEMADREARRPAGERLDFVSVVTPNVLHFDVSKTLLEAGFNVVCDKPMTYTLEQALELRRIVARRRKRSSPSPTTTPATRWSSRRGRWCATGSSGTSEQGGGRVPAGLALEHARGESGHSRRVAHGPRSVAGAAGCMGDIGSHCENLAELHHRPRDRRALRRPHHLRPGPQARRRRQRPPPLQGRRAGRPLRLPDLRRRGERPQHPGLRQQGRAGLAPGEPELPAGSSEPRRPGRSSYSAAATRTWSDAAKASTRLPTGHPEGFIEAFANVYREAFKAISSPQVSGEKPPGPGLSHGRGRRARHGVHRGGRGELEVQR